MGTSDSSCLRLFFQYSSDLCAHVNSTGTILDCNPAFLSAASLNADQAAGEGLGQLVTFVGGMPDIAAAAAVPTKLRGGFANDESGKTYSWRIVGSREDEFGVIGSDTTEFDRSMSNLASVEKHLAAVLETTVDGIITIDDNGLMVSANRAAEEIFGHRAKDMIGKNVSFLMPEPYRDEHDDYIDRYIATGERRIIGIGREVNGLRKDGTIFPMDLAVSEVKTTEGRFFTGVVRDITARREMEKEILRISEEERRRIGQDLHDELGQMLTGIGLLSLSLSKKLEEQEIPEAEQLREITKLIKEADQYARTLARGLVPVELQSNGLSAALERLTRDAETLFGVNCTFSERGSNMVRDLTKTVHIYRIAQEAISNASKHGHASRIRVDLIGTPEHLRLRIRDNGSGFATDWQRNAGMGVHIMHYRAKLVGGALDISNLPEGGTMVQCQVPVARGIASAQAS